MIGIITHIIPFGKKFLDLIYAKRENERLTKENVELKAENKKLNALLRRSTKGARKKET